MISCTEFIPCYSELFTWLDENKGGHAEVERFWTYLFEPTGKGIPLINYARKDGLKGCLDYWAPNMEEEAADCISYTNLDQGWSVSTMNYCPSKGRLLELEKEIGLVPYYDYCGHCDYYRSALDEVGIGWIRNHMDVDKASCSSILYDPKIFKGIMVKDENTVIVRCTPEGKEYFHQEFHSSMNMGIEYLGANYGREAVRDFLEMYVGHVYCRELEAIRKDGLKAIEAYVRNLYKLEKAEDAVETELTQDCLKVTVFYCPAVKYLKKTGRDVSSWYRYTTEDVMDILAKEGGFKFTMESYDEETGAAAYKFEKQTGGCL